MVGRVLGERMRGAGSIGGRALRPIAARGARGGRSRWLVLAGGLVLGSALLGGGGCAMTTERSYQVDVSEGVRLLGLDVENFAGDVVVRATRGASTRLDAYVTTAGGMSADERDRFRDAIDVAVGVSEDAPGVATLRVRCDSLLAAEGRHDVRLELTVPRADGVRVESRGGLVELVGVGGDIEVMNAGGPVFIRTARALNDRLLIRNVNGDVFVQVPDGSTGALYLESLDGTVRVKDEFGRTADTSAGMSRLTTSLAGGANAVDIRTSSGVVEYLVMRDPVGYSRAVIGKTPVWQDGLGLDSYRRFTRNLPDDDLPDPVNIGDGSYFGSPTESASNRVNREARDPG